MAKLSTSGARTLLRVYKNYGGFKSLFRSEYFLVSVTFAAFSWPLTEDNKWADIAKSILPNLAGFSIAAYAIFFTILDEKARDALRRPSEKLDGRSPLLMLVSSITHAVFVQILALIMSIAIPSHSIPGVAEFDFLNKCAKYTLSSIGLVTTIYAIVLIIAAVLSIYRLLEMQQK